MFAGEHPPAAATAPSPTSTVPPTGAEVAAGVKVDAGLTAGKVMGCDTAASRPKGVFPPVDGCPPQNLAPVGDGVTYGIVVENTTDQVLHDLPITFRFVDAQGAMVPERATIFSKTDPRPTRELVDLWPGQRYGFGGFRYTEHPGATHVQVVVGPPDEWEPEAAYTLNFPAAVRPGGLTADGVRVDYGIGHQPIVHFTLRSGADRVLRPLTTWAILRDAKGHIIGAAEGDFSEREIRPGEAVSYTDVVPGAIEVPGIDPAKVETFANMPVPVE